MNFYCLFPGLMNFDLVKHVGLTPYYLMSEVGYKSTIVCLNNDDYTNLDNMGELNLDVLKKYSWSILNHFLIIFYLIKNAKKIDVLNCFHLTIPTMTYFLIYKIFNRKGISYFTFDIPYYRVLNLTNTKKSIINFFKSSILLFLFKYLIDFANIEHIESYELFINFNEVYKEKLMYMPIFIEPNENIEKDKKNQIVSVGRIGSYYKASDVVLESFKNVVTAINDEKWVLKMVGPIEEDFQEYIENFFVENPSLKDSVIFTGNIEDKDELYSIYSESKIFCLPSRSESFGIVFVEALFYGDFLVTTNVGITNYLKNISNFGLFVEIDDVEDLSNKLIDVIVNYESYSKINFGNFKKLIKNEFSHKRYIKELDSNLKNIK